MYSVGNSTFLSAFFELNIPPSVHVACVTDRRRRRYKSKGLAKRMKYGGREKKETERKTKRLHTVVI